ncbi:hypothetical protein P9112_012562 [Eukaryota sp. TZLM1-RC]
MYPVFLIGFNTTDPTVPAVLSLTDDTIVFYKCPVVEAYDTTQLTIFADVATSLLKQKPLSKLLSINVHNELHSLSFASDNQSIFRLTLSQSNHLVIYSKFRSHILLQLSSLVPASFLSQLRPIVAGTHLSADLYFDVVYNGHDSQLFINKEGVIIPKLLSLKLNEINRVKIEEKSNQSHYDLLISSSGQNDTFQHVISVTFDPYYELLISISFNLTQLETFKNGNQPNNHITQPNQEDFSSLLLFLSQGTKLTKHYQKRTFGIKSKSSSKFHWKTNVRHFSVDCSQSLLLWGKTKNSQKKHAVITGVDLCLPSSLTLSSSLRNTFRITFLDRPSLYLTARSKGTFESWYQGLSFLSRNK